jgi:hypothetical protein
MFKKYSSFGGAFKVKSDLVIHNEEVKVNKHTEHPIDIKKRADDDDDFLPGERLLIKINKNRQKQRKKKKNKPLEIDRISDRLSKIIINNF